MLIRQGTLEDTRWIIHHRRHMHRDMGVSDEVAQEAADLYLPFLEKDWTPFF